MFTNIQPAVRKETARVFAITFIGVAIMIAVFALLHKFMPDTVPMDHTVVLGGICGGAVAVLNFFLMCLTVQRVATLEDPKKANLIMTASQSRRLVLQVIWIFAAIAAPVFQPVAGILPLLFPGAGINILRRTVLKNM